MKKEKTELATVPEAKPMTSITALISQGLTTGASVDAMKGLYDIYTQERAEACRMAFNEAMAKFQHDCPIIEKTTVVASGGRTLYKYAKIEDIVSQVKDLIEANGFSYQVKTGARENMLFATTIVKHNAGHSEETTFEVPQTAGTNIMSGPQKQASSLTFAKRYSFCNAFGIMTGDEDNDATTERGDSAAPVEETPFQLASKMIKAAKTVGSLASYRTRVAEHETLTNQEKIKLYELIESRKAAIGK